MYYCAVHKVAFETPKQWAGHCVAVHLGEPRVKAKDAFVEQVPEGTEIVRPQPRRPDHRRQAPADDPSADSTDPIETRVPTDMMEFTSQYQDEEEGRLDEALEGIGATPVERQTVVKGWRRFPVLHQHPHNLETYILGILGPKKRQSVGLVVHTMFPGAEQEVPDTPYVYAGHNGPGQMYFPGQQPQYPQQWGQAPYVVYNQSGRPSTSNGEANPEVVALQKQVDGILGELQAERAERAREKQDRDAKDRDATWQAQLNAVTAKVDGTFKDLSTLLQGLHDQVQKGHSEVEASHTQQLAEKVTTLAETIASQREAALLTSVDAVHKELAAVQQKLSAEPIGKTTEDLISQGAPLLMERLDSLGTMIGGELKGIRAQAGAGQLPGLAPPNPVSPGRTPGAASPVETAQQIAGARQIEDDILRLAGVPARSGMG